MSYGRERYNGPAMAILWTEEDGSARGRYDQNPTVEFHAVEDREQMLVKLRVYCAFSGREIANLTFRAAAANPLVQVNANVLMADEDATWVLVPVKVTGAKRALCRRMSNVGETGGLL